MLMAHLACSRFNWSYSSFQAVRHYALHLACWHVLFYASLNLGSDKPEQAPLHTLPGGLPVHICLRPKRVIV